MRIRRRLVAGAVLVASAAAAVGLWSTRSPVEWLGPAPGGADGPVRVADGWLAIREGVDGGIAVQPVTGGPPRELLARRSWDAWEGAVCLAGGQLYVTGRAGLRSFPLSGGPARQVVKPEQAVAMLLPPGVRAAERRAAQTALTGWETSLAVRGRTAYWLVSEVSLGGPIQQSSVWAVPTAGGSPRKLIEGRRTWLELGSCDDGLTWWEEAPTHQERERSLYTLRHLRLGDQMPSAWHDVDEWTGASARAWRGRWYCVDAPSGDPDADDAWPLALWTVALDGTGRRPVLTPSGRPAVVDEFVVVHPAERAGAWALAPSPGRASTDLCRLTRRGAVDGLQPVCSLPGGWRWRCLAFDSGYLHLVAVPRQEGRMAAWLRKLLRRPRVPMLCRLRVVG